jgi:HPt (histidine-containing phosphotransfer) domain-containing protein
MGRADPIDSETRRRNAERPTTFDHRVGNRGVVATTAAGFPVRSIPPAKWADQVCDSVKQWVDSIQAEAQQIQSELGTKPSTAETKASLSSFLGTLTSETAQLVSRLEDSGTPDTPKGKAAHLAFVRGFSRVERAIHRLEGQAKAVSLKHPKVANAALQRIGTRMQRTLSNMGVSFGDLAKFDPGKRLKQAFRGSKVCQAMSA